MKALKGSPTRPPIQRKAPPPVPAPADDEQATQPGMEAPVVDPRMPSPLGPPGPPPLGPPPLAKPPPTAGSPARPAAARAPQPAPPPSARQADPPPTEEKDDEATFIFAGGAAAAEGDFLSEADVRDATMMLASAGTNGPVSAHGGHGMPSPIGAPASGPPPAMPSPLGPSPAAPMHAHAHAPVPPHVGPAPMAAMANPALFNTGASQLGAMRPPTPSYPGMPQHAGPMPSYPGMPPQTVPPGYMPMPYGAPLQQPQPSYPDGSQPLVLGSQGVVMAPPPGMQPGPMSVAARPAHAAGASSRPSILALGGIVIAVAVMAVTAIVVWRRSADRTVAAQPVATASAVVGSAAPAAPPSAARGAVAPTVAASAKVATVASAAPPAAPPATGTAKAAAPTAAAPTAAAPTAAAPTAAAPATGAAAAPTAAPKAPASNEVIHGYKPKHGRPNSSDFDNDEPDKP